MIPLKKLPEFIHLLCVLRNWLSKIAEYFGQHLHPLKIALLDVLNTLICPKTQTLQSFTSHRESELNTIHRQHKCASLGHGAPCRIIVHDSSNARKVIVRRDLTSDLRVQDRQTKTNGERLIPLPQKRKHQKAYI